MWSAGTMILDNFLAIFKRNLEGKCIFWVDLPAAAAGGLLSGVVIGVFHQTQN